MSKISLRRFVAPNIVRSLAIALLCAGHLHAAQLTLPEAILQALANEPELRASRGRVEVAAGQAAQAGRWSNPELQLSMEDWQLGGIGWSSSKRTVGVSQTVAFPGKKSLDRKVGSAGVRLSQAELALRVMETIRAVKVAFYQVIAAGNMVKEGEGLVQTTEKLAAAAKKRVEAGAAPEQEGLRAEIPLEKARLGLADSVRELALARRTLVALLGQSDLGEGTLAGILAESADPQLLARQPEVALAKHPSQEAAQTNVTRAGLALRRARLDALPDVTVGLGAGREAMTNAAIGEIRVGLPLPIFDGSGGKRRESRGNLAVAEAEEAAVGLKLSREWNAAAARVRSASEQAGVFRERILPKANEVLRRTQTGFDEGKFLLTDLIETQRSAAELRIGYQQKLLELNIAQADLEALLGKHN